MDDKMTSCIFCKGDETDENPMYKKPDTCLCNPIIHDSCLYKICNLYKHDASYTKDHKKTIEDYAHEKYGLCRTCKNKYGTTSTTINNKLHSLQTIYQPSINTVNLRFSITNPKSIDKYRHYQTYTFNIKLKLDPVLVFDAYYNSTSNEHGETLIYHDIYPHNLKEKYTSTNGSRHGTTTEYYCDGKIKRKQEYINGFQEGKDIRYYCNDKNTIESECTYHLNMINGYMRNYYETGTLIDETFYINDNLSYMKPHRKYNENGKLLIEIVAFMEFPFHNDDNNYELVNYKEYNLDGTIKSESKKYYKRNSLDRCFLDYDIPSMKYHENGKIKERKTFINPDDANEDFDKIMSNHQLIYNGFNKLILVETFYATGAKHERYTIKHDPCGTWNGPHITWHSNGKYKKICEYVDNRLIHQCGSWDSDGVLQSYGKYNSDGILIPIGLGL